MKTIHITHPTGIVRGHIDLEGSKSISNRVLIIRALSPGPFKINRLSISDDTSILQKLLNNGHDNHYNVGHAGTSFRFLTAFLAFRNGTQVLTGSERMKERPIGPLVDALNFLGARIEYLEEQGYPPLKIGPPSKQVKNRVRIDAGISSQYLTALLLIGPTLPEGLTLELEGNMVSESYLNLTLGIIGSFGIEYKRDRRTIHLAPQSYVPRTYTIEADWSACSYYFALSSLAKKAELSISGLMEESLQGDSALMQLAPSLGVGARFVNEQLILTKLSDWAPSKLTYDFINQPDIAQTLAVVCASEGLEAKFRGLKTLRIKETDRIAALDIELGKLGGSFRQVGQYDDDPVYSPGFISTNTTAVPVFDTYKDHRMAMALAPIALKMPIRMNNPGVVTKSYTLFWEDLKKLGFEIYSVSE